MTPTPPPRLVPDRPSAEFPTPSPAAVKKAKDEAATRQFPSEMHWASWVIDRAREIDAAAPPAEAPAEAPADKYSDFTRAELIDLLDKAYDQITAAEAPVERGEIVTDELVEAGAKALCVFHWDTATERVRNDCRWSARRVLNGVAAAPAAPATERSDALDIAEEDAAFEEDPNGQHCSRCGFTMSGIGYCANCGARDTAPRVTGGREG